MKIDSRSLHVHGEQLGGFFEEHMSWLQDFKFSAHIWSAALNSNIIVI